MRNTFIVTAQIVDSNGTHAFLDGYPKKFDSKNYENKATERETAVDIARKRADGEFSETWAAMCKNDARQIQTVTLEDVYGNQLDRKSMGTYVEVEPEPEPEAE